MAIARLLSFGDQREQRALFAEPGRAESLRQRQPVWLSRQIRREAATARHHDRQ
ncbi:hypothetical protein [Lamprobacter modestohalophilus]|uniref:hypothetical protein n=1 Tax=Lamprobacter modestohalophilus TaxID=1064514 RepID=UPI001906B061|nr:hypothetical protein [Lamprobacter modestohalophilus]